MNKSFSFSLVRRLGLAFMLILTGSAAEAQRPNIIIILADDLGYGDLGCYGSTEHRTPNLDKLASEGMRFTDFHANGPMCSPTRAALLTGRYQQRSGIERVIGGFGSRGLPLEAKTIAEYLRAAGYPTGMYGKWHLGYPPEELPTGQGFDDFWGHLYGDSDHHSRIDRNGNEDWWHKETLVKEEGYNTYLINRHSLKFVEDHKDKPFFLYVPHSAVHFPWQGPGDKADRVKGVDATKIKHGSRKDQRVALGEMLGAIDAGVGQIVAKLRELGLDRRTLIFFTSDNGGYLSVSSNGPLRGEKGSMYEGGHREPAIAWWPGRIQPGTVCHETALTMDLLPTALELCGQSLPQGNDKLDGVSLVPVLSGKNISERTLFWRMGAKAVRQGVWKMVVKENKPELFNLADDLGEKNDLAGQNPEVVKRLSQSLAEWEKSVDAVGGVNVSSSVRKKN